MQMKYGVRHAGMLPGNLPRPRGHLPRGRRLFAHAARVVVRAGTCCVTDRRRQRLCAPFLRARRDLQAWWRAPAHLPTSAEWVPPGNRGLYPSANGARSETMPTTCFAATTSADNCNVMGDTCRRHVRAAAPARRVGAWDTRPASMNMHHAGPPGAAAEPTTTAWDSVCDATLRCALPPPARRAADKRRFRNHCKQNANRDHAAPRAHRHSLTVPSRRYRDHPDCGNSIAACEHRALQRRLP